MHTMRRFFPALLLLLGVLLAHSETAQACSCVQATPAESADRAELIFLGTVGETALTNRGRTVSSADPVRVTFDVQTVYKGEADATLTLETARDSASCGYAFQVGGSYLVYARAVDGKLTTDLCSGTKPEFEATADLTFLGGGTVVGNLSGTGFPAWIGIVLATGVGALLLAGLLAAINSRIARRRGQSRSY